MGDLGISRFSEEGPGLKSCADVLIVASARYVSALSGILPGNSFPGLTIIETDADEAIPDEHFRRASLAVVEVDPDNAQSIERLTRMHRTQRSVPIIAAISDASVNLVRTLIREGVSDVISLPFVPGDLLEAALDAVARRSAETVIEQHLAPMVAVTRSTGGCGATSIATQLAADLARKSEQGGTAVVVDLDLQFGSVADILGAVGRGSIADMIETDGLVDDELVRSVSRSTEDGIAVIAAPDEIIPLESVDTDKLLKALEELRRYYAYVVLDLPANWTNWTLSAAASADLVIMVAELSVQSLRQAKRRLDLFQSVGIPKSRIAVVVNRFEKKLFHTISLQDVADTLRHPVQATVSLDEPAVSSSQDQGRLVTGLHRRSRFGADVGKLAESLLAGPLGGRQ